MVAGWVSNAASGEGANDLSPYRESRPRLTRDAPPVRQHPVDITARPAGTTGNPGGKRLDSTRTDNDLADKGPTRCSLGTSVTASGVEWVRRSRSCPSEDVLRHFCALCPAESRGGR